MNGWLCTHRWPAVVGMVGFHNHVAGSPVLDYVTGGSQQAAFGRGTLGFVIINNSDSPWSSSFSTSLPDGSYCDVVAGNHDGTTCAGSQCVYVEMSHTYVTGVFGLITWIIGTLLQEAASLPL